MTNAMLAMLMCWQQTEHAVLCAVTMRKKIALTSSSDKLCHCSYLSPVHRFVQLLSQFDHFFRKILTNFWMKTIKNQTQFILLNGSDLTTIWIIDSHYILWIVHIDSSMLCDQMKPYEVHGIVVVVSMEMLVSVVSCCIVCLWFVQCVRCDWKQSVRVIQYLRVGQFGCEAYAKCVCIVYFNFIISLLFTDLTLYRSTWYLFRSDGYFFLWYLVFAFILIWILFDSVCMCVFFIAFNVAIFKQKTHEQVLKTISNVNITVVTVSNFRIDIKHRQKIHNLLWH